jgi:hypothetical protein
MNKAKPGLLFVCAIGGVVLEQIIQHFFGGNVVLWSLIILFAFLIGISFWNKRKKITSNPDEQIHETVSKDRTPR